MARDDECTLRCDGLVVGHGGIPLLPPFTAALRPGESWAVIGRNGAGKSTWIRTLLGLLSPVSGRVIREPPDLPLAYIPQRTTYDPIVPLQAETVVRMGLERDRSFLVPGFARRREGEVRAAMEAAGCADLAGHGFRTLSEGQKQKVLLARVLVGGPAIAFFDEPTAAMDVVAEGEALARLDALRRERGIGLVVVSHFLKVAARYADRVLFFDREGQIVIHGSPDEIFANESFLARYGDHARAALEVR